MERHKLRMSGGEMGGEKFGLEAVVFISILKDCGGWDKTTEFKMFAKFQNTE